MMMTPQKVISKRNWKAILKRNGKTSYSRGIPEEDVGLQGNEDSVQFTIENVPEPSNEKVATFSVEPDFQNVRNYFSFCLITMFYFIADNE